MVDFINKFIAENLGVSVIILIGFFVFLVFAVWKIAIIYSKIKNLKCDENTKEIKALKEKSFDKNELPCGIHKEKMNDHDNAVIRIETSLKFLTKELDNAINLMQKKTNLEGFTKTNSPLAITQSGYEMMERLGISKMFENNWARIKELIDNNVKSKNAYDINNFCIEQAVVFPEKFLNDEEIDKLKNDAYMNGITLSPYMKVIAVLSRDRYFKEEGISIVDIDTKH